MRLTEFQTSRIQEGALNFFGSHSHVWLFGSRVDDDKRGGDIDLKVAGLPLLGQIVKHGIRLVGDDVRYGMLLSRSAFDYAGVLLCRQRILDIRRPSWIGC